MNKQILVALFVIGFSAPALTAAVRSTDINKGPQGPVFAEPTLTITSGQTVEWIPKTDPGVPHQLFRLKPDGTRGEAVTEEFTAPNKGTHAFTAAGVEKIQCRFHPRTMNQTIT